MVVVNDVCLGAAVSRQEAGRRGGDQREGMGKWEAQGWVSQGAWRDCWLRQGLLLVPQFPAPSAHPVASVHSAAYLTDVY